MRGVGDGEQMTTFAAPINLRTVLAELGRVHSPSRAHHRAVSS